MPRWFFTVRGNLENYDITKCEGDAMRSLKRKVSLQLLVAAGLFLHPSLLLAQTNSFEFSNEFLISIQRPRTESSLPELGSWTLQPLFSTKSSETHSRFEDLEQPSQWFLATPKHSREEAAESTPTANPWDLAHQMIDGKAPSSYNKLIRAARSAGTLREIEPSVIPSSKVDKTEPRADCPGETVGDIVICSQPSPHWPSGNTVAWHLQDAYTQLASARAAARAYFPYPACDGDIVTVAHLDTGYDQVNDHATPPCFQPSLSKSYLPNESDGGYDHFTGHNPGHGPGTLSILAGGRVKIATGAFGNFDDFLGGAPFVRVFSYRITDSVAVIWPKLMAQAIRDASRAGADVITLSIGGAPSGVLRDAVNDAYDNGTAIFAATGDFIRFPLTATARTPHTLVYPARFSRTMPVAGITAGERSYGLDPGYLTLLHHGGWSSWMLRGSYGPTSVMKNAIAAYTPNITRHHASPAHRPDLIDLDFAGTSAATPQVAAAAALWLQAHRSDLNGEWRTWRKTEAVYQALAQAARHNFSAYSREYFGTGILQARDTLALSPKPTVAQPRAVIGFDWVTAAAAVIRRGREEMVNADQSLHEQMLRTEVAQLFSSSRKLQQLEPALDMESIPADAMANVRQALLSDPRASEYLKAAIRAASR